MAPPRKVRRTLKPDRDRVTDDTRFFSVEEAAVMIPELRELFRQAHKELGRVYDQVVLYKRLYGMQHEEREAVADQTEAVLDQKVAAFEACHRRWEKQLNEQGVILRDVQRGLVDFPYRSMAGEVFMLSWHLGEDGVFYFHEPDENYRARKPISLLPE